MIRLILSFMLVTTFVYADQVTIKANHAHYQPSQILLEGQVQLTHEMGQLIGDEAVLTHDSTGEHQLDYPWIELNHNVCITLNEGQTLTCTCARIDSPHLCAHLYGSPQIHYLEEDKELFANHARIDYMDDGKKLHITKITLSGNIQMIKTHLPGEKPALQYVLADQVEYFPEEQYVIFTGDSVLFYDKLQEMQLSAHTVHAHRNRETQKDLIQGVGDVRFRFAPDELAKFKERFKWQQPPY